MGGADSRPARRVRLVATDLDGTLLRADQTISPRTRRAIREAHRAGIRVIAATGRGWRSATPLLAGVPEIDIGVMSNGSLVRDLRRHRDLHHFPIDAPALATVLARIREHVPRAGLYWETATVAAFDHRYREIMAGLHPELERDGRTPLDGPPDDEPLLKLLIRDPERSHDELFAHLVPHLPPTVTASFSGGPNLVEITGHGVHKASALAFLCRAWGIDASEVVAVGDNHNDAEMLRWAGLGVAVANASPEAVAASDRRTGHHLDDGVAALIEGLLDGEAERPED